MSSSWNFPSGAKPSYQGAELSQAKLNQAELGHFNLRAETELSIFFSRTAHTEII
jgi:hypothetical protein